MNNAQIVIATLLLGLVVACDEKKPETVDAGTPVVAASATTASTTTGEDTEEDFEEAAQASITPDNLEAELAKLEAELK